MARTFKTNQTLINAGFNQLSGGTLSLSGNTLIGKCGTLKYATDQHTKFTSLSVVDAAYVTGKTTAIINIGSNQQIIYRDISGITGATNFLYDKALSGVTVPNLSISIAPADTASNYVLTWNECSCKVNKLHASCAIGLTSAVNGLSVFNNCATLGGVLICDTVINGCDSYSLGFCNLCYACISATKHNIVIDNQCNSGGIYLKSQTGTISTDTDYCNAVGISVNYNVSHGFAIYDNRPPALQSGIEYANNYASFYTSRSLVDKEYVDTLAAGLHPHAAVVVATTGNTALLGLVYPVIIDGITLADGNRVLIKNQIAAQFNGIYILTGGSTTFVRATDFDESSETIQGAYTYVLSGGTNGGTSWILSTPNPILINVTPLLFTLFTQPSDVVAGIGICISKYFNQDTICVNGIGLAGNSMSWNGSTCQFDVNVSSGTLATALGNAITGATNGLTKSGQIAKLGGILTGTTNINGSQIFNINVSTLNLTGSTAINLTSSAVTLQTTPSVGTISDSVVVWNSIDKKLKTIAGSCLGNKNNIYSISAVTTSVILNTGSSYVILISGGTSITVTLPVTPINGQVFRIKDACGNALTHNVIIDSGAGKTIDGSQCAVINTDYGALELMYGATNKWFGLAFVN